MSDEAEYWWAFYRPTGDIIPVQVWREDDGEIEAISMMGDETSPDITDFDLIERFMPPVVCG